MLVIGFQELVSCFYLMPNRYSCFLWISPDHFNFQIFAKSLQQVGCVLLRQYHLLTGSLTGAMLFSLK